MALIEDFPAEDMLPVDGEGASDDQAVWEWLTDAPAEKNLLDLLDASDVANLGKRVCEEYEIDCRSRKAWKDRLDRAQKLAALEKDEKNYPFPKAANIKYPLIMTAALRFNADAYPALVPPGDIVKARINGKDANGAKKIRAAIVAETCSWQLRNEIESWEADTDKLLMDLAIAGTMHRKAWYDPSEGRRCIKLLAPGALVVNDGVPSLKSAPRLTEEIELYPDEVEGRVRSGLFKGGDWRDVDGDEEEDDSLAPMVFLEQHRRHDLDGDGYPEPYIVTVHKASQTVVRVVANWRPDEVMVNAEGEVVKIDPVTYYIDYHFMPGVSGGYHSIGLGVLLGDLSETIDSLLNMLADAGHMQTMGSGWIGKEARLGVGSKPFKPGEYRNVPSTGMEVRSAVVERQIAPSPVLFQLLGMMIDSARELANVQNLQEQSQRSNQPATTTVVLAEQGKAIYTAIFKRIFRSLKQEFTALAKMNAETMTPDQLSRFMDETGPEGEPIELDPRAVFDLADMDIEPVADPRAVTSMQKMAHAQLLREMGATGEIDRGAATIRVLDAAGVPDAEDLIPKPDPAQQQVQATVMAEQIKGVQLDNVKKQGEAMKAFAAAALSETEIMLKRAEVAKAVAEGMSEDMLAPLDAALKEAQAFKARASGILDLEKAGEANRAGTDGMGGASDNAPGVGRS